MYMKVTAGSFLTVRLNKRGTAVDRKSVFVKLVTRGSALLVAVGCAAYVGQSVRLAAQDKTTADGVYTDEQAQKGKAVYVRKCAACHGEDMGGADEPMVTPALVGDKFLKNWSDKSLGLLFEKMQTTMPGDMP